MSNATESRQDSTLSLLLAGLQAGMIGALMLLAWMGFSATMQRRSFWTAANLMGTVFHGGDAIHSGFTSSTLVGLAFYLVAYSLLGSLFAVALRLRLPSLRRRLVAVLFALCWYYFFFRLASRPFAPLIDLLHVENTTLIGHLIYGTVLGRYPAFLERKAVPPPAPEPEPESAPASQSE
jgi:hypothetical protein